LLQKGPHQNGPATKWATPKRATTKQATPKWLRKKTCFLQKSANKKKVQESLTVLQEKHNMIDRSLSHPFLKVYFGRERCDGTYSHQLASNQAATYKKNLDI